jgi:hypothetical protein
MDSSNWQYASISLAAADVIEMEEGGTLADRFTGSHTNFGKRSFFKAVPLDTPSQPIQNRFRGLIFPLLFLCFFVNTRSRQRVSGP